MEHQRLGTPNRRSAHYPRFSEAEFDRRRARVRELMAERDLDALLVYGDGGLHGSKLAYLTNYAPPFPTYLAFFADPAEGSMLFAGISNHVQYVAEVAEVDDVRLMLPDPPTPVCERLAEAGVDGDRVGLVVDDPRYNLSVPAPHARTFEAELGATPEDVTADYTRLVSVLGEEELDLIYRAGEVLDHAMEGLETAIEPGVTEQDLAAAMGAAAGEAGGDLALAFVSSAPMEGAEPGEPLPWKAPSSRPIERGDVVTTEISAGVRGYDTQIHRPYAVGEAPTDVYEDLFSVAEEAYDGILDALQPGNTAADVHAAAAPIAESEYKVYDVLCHGYGAGYRHPFIGVEASNYWPGAEDPLTAGWTFEPGMVIVVQPNVVTHDETAGLQYGTTVVITEGGHDVLQDYPTGFHRA